MTKTQMALLMLPPVATMILVAVGVLINDFRMGQIDGQILGMKSSILGMQSHMDGRFDELRDIVREDLHLFGDHIDSRLKRIAERRS
jgi:hypothetical protein